MYLLVKKTYNIQPFIQAAVKKVLIKTRTRMKKKWWYVKKKKSGNNVRTTAAYFDTKIPWVMEIVWYSFPFGMPMKTWKILIRGDSCTK